MDEWILAGDAHFMARAETRVRNFVERASVVVLASHNLDLCRRWCTTGIWLDRGAIREMGPIDEVVRRYQAFVSTGAAHCSLSYEAQPVAPVKYKLSYQVRRHRAVDLDLARDTPE